MSENAKIQDAVVISGENSENVIENRVKKEISKFNLADAGVDALIKRADGLEVASLEDVEKYEEIKSVLREFVSTRTGIDKKRKEINKPFDEIIKGVNEEGKRLTALLAPHENRLASERAKYEAWKKEEEEREAREEEERLQERIEELKSAGLVYNPEAMLYEVGDSISLDVVTIKKQSDSDYAFLLAKVTDERAKIEKRLEEERIAREEEERKQREIAEKNEQDRRELRAEKLETRTGRLTDAGFKIDEKNERFYYSNGDLQILKSYDEIADMPLADFRVFMASAGQTILDHENNIKILEEQERKNRERNERRKKIENLGFQFDGGFYVYKSISVPADEALDAENFEEVYSDLKSKIETVNREEAEAEENRRRAEEEARETARLEALPDLDKIERYLKEINAIPVPQMKTEAGAQILIELSERVRQLVEEFSETIKKAK